MGAVPPYSYPLKRSRSFFDSFSCLVTRKAGNPAAFLTAVGSVIVWAVCGPVFHFSESWQLVINTGTTIITFLMVFLIQQAQNKETVALHIKLNELIAATKGASNRLIDVEDLTDKELQVLKAFYVQLTALSKKDKDLTFSHSIEEAAGKHNFKLDEKKPSNSRWHKA